MLSRVALAPRLATAAARLSRPAVSPIIRARPAAPLSPWVRSFADKPNQAGKQPPSSKPTPPDSAAESSSDGAPKDAQPKDEPEQIPFDKLPDLTQGIPSTLDQEMASRSGRAQSALEAVEQEEAGGRGGRGGRRDEYVSTSERNRRWWTRFLLATTAAGGVLSLVYMGRDWDDVIEAERHRDIPNGWGISLWWQRVRARMGESVSYYQDPAFDKLLPDPDPSFERPYTLCLSLDDLLVHSEWSREHGWRVAKRPGMDYFVRYLSQYYELVLFTTVPFAMGEPIVRKLDPFRFIMWPLYREATKYEDGEIVKVGSLCAPLHIFVTSILTYAGPLVPQPSPLQGHHYRHIGLACPQATRKRHYPRPVEGRGQGPGPRRPDPLPRVYPHDAVLGCAQGAQVIRGQAHPD